MERLSLDQQRVEELRAEWQGYYPDNAKPCPGSSLKLDDDVAWQGMHLRVVWGHDDPHFFNAYGPDYFGDAVVNLDGRLITDRAPANPEEEPMPIWPPPPDEKPLL
jgi:hypothetical protein